MGAELAAIAYCDAYSRSKKGLKPPGHPAGVPPKRTEEAVQELFDELELPYDLTGVEILKEYICEQGKEKEAEKPS